MNDETTSVDEQDEIDATNIEHGPSVDELSNAPAADGGTEPASADDGAGDGDSNTDTNNRDAEPTPPATYTRVRIEHADGSRSWHVEQTGDAELAERLARGRDLGTVIRSEPMETDNDGTD